MKKQQVGIWLDTQDAYLIRMNGAEAHVDKVTSSIDTGEAKGGTGSGTPWGPQVSGSDSKLLERRKHAEKDYFEAIKDQIKTADELYIFGPAEIKVRLEKALAEDKSFKPKVLAVEPADSMTQNQLIAKVKDFFSAAGSGN